MKRLIRLLLLSALSGVCLGAHARAVDPALAQRQAQAQEEQGQLRKRIDELNRKIAEQESSRRDAAQALKASEQQISAISLQLEELGGRADEVRVDLRRLEKRKAERGRDLQTRQQELSEQLRAQYANDLSPWSALLSGEDPHRIGRDLSYLGYVSKSQAKAVRDVRQAIDELAAVRERLESSQRELVDLSGQTALQKRELEKQKAERASVLASIEGQLKAQRGQAQTLARDEARLGELVDGLRAELQRQERAARLAEEKRRREQAQKAEQARQAALQRQRELERERERLRQAEIEARRMQEQARHEQERQEAEKARIQVEQALARAKQAEQEEARNRAKAEEADRQVQAQLRAAANSGTAGLARGLPHPVRGEILGQFGAQRPDGGGIWRGIVLRAPEGTPVKVVANGRVVYANWLSGFGNIMIVDHGAQYLSVYAYNQSLLKRVGDVVKAGDVIASVGATGGQVEPGLYFEIRHNATPVNPLLWLRR